MKRHISLLLVFTIACSPQLRVYTDFDPVYELAGCRTFDWLDKTNIEAGKNPMYYNELNDKRIKSAVERELGSRGYGLSDSNAELVIHYHILIDDKETVLPEHEASNYGPYWQRAPANVYTFREGTLIIDMMDVNNNLVWRGAAISPIEEIYTPEKTTKLINDAVKKMFKSFPDTKHKE